MLIPLNQRTVLFSALLVAVLLAGGALYFLGSYLFPIPKTKDDSNGSAILSRKTGEQTQNLDARTPTDSNSHPDLEWKVYKNEALHFSVQYPTGFRIDDVPRDSGHVVSFMEFNENSRNLRGQTVPGYHTVIAVDRWDDINDPYLKGGTWENELTYRTFQEFLADSAHTYINIIGTTEVDGVEAYILSIPGEIGYEAIMFEYGGGYYQISFPWTEKALDKNTKERFLSSFAFDE